MRTIRKVIYEFGPDTLGNLGDEPARSVAKFKKRLRRRLRALGGSWERVKVSVEETEQESWSFVDQCGAGDRIDTGEVGREIETALAALKEDRSWVVDYGPERRQLLAEVAAKTAAARDAMAELHAFMESLRASHADLDPRACTACMEESDGEYGHGLRHALPREVEEAWGVISSFANE